MDLNSKPDFPLEEYSDSSFFPRVCFIATDCCGVKGFLSHNQ